MVAGRPEGPAVAQPWTPTEEDLAEARRQAAEVDANTPTNEELAAIPIGRITIGPEQTRFYEMAMEENDWFHLRVVRPKTLQAERCMDYAIAALNSFVEKNAGYGEPDTDDLGSRGQFADMHRKWKLLRKHLWEGQPWTHHEPFDLVCMELIGHLLLTMDFKDQSL